MKVSIYALVDPDTERVMYVGQTSDVEARLYAHVHRPADVTRDWICGLTKDGGQPALVVLQESDDVNANSDEAFWTRAFSERGSLLNVRHNSEMVSKVRREVWVSQEVARRMDAHSDDHGICNETLACIAIEKGLDVLDAEEAHAKIQAHSIMATLGRLGGRSSALARTPEQRRERASRAGKASAAKMSPEARRERARKAGVARWEKERQKGEHDHD